MSISFKSSQNFHSSGKGKTVCNVQDNLKLIWKTIYNKLYSGYYYCIIHFIEISVHLFQMSLTDQKLHKLQMKLQQQKYLHSLPINQPAVCLNSYTELSKNIEILQESFN